MSHTRWQAGAKMGSMTGGTPIINQYKETVMAPNHQPPQQNQNRHAEAEIHALARDIVTAYRGMAGSTIAALGGGILDNSDLLPPEASTVAFERIAHAKARVLAEALHKKGISGFKPKDPRIAEAVASLTDDEVENIRIGMKEANADAFKGLTRIAQYPEGHPKEGNTLPLDSAEAEAAIKGAQKSLDTFEVMIGGGLKGFRDHQRKKGKGENAEPVTPQAPAGLPITATHRSTPQLAL